MLNMFWTIVIVLIILFILGSVVSQKKRREWKENYIQFLTGKFGKETAELIFSSSPWIGQSDEEFLAMYGHPNHIEKVEMKTKTKLVLSYATVNGSTNRSTNNKYTFENNFLIKTEIKGGINKVWEAKKQVNPFTEKP